MRIALELRLLVAGHTHQGVEDARGVGIEVQYLADAAAVLEVEPPGILEARDQPAGRVSQEGRLCEVGCRLGSLERLEQIMATFPSRLGSTRSC
jgi:hypothetical protein